MNIITTSPTGFSIEAGNERYDLAFNSVWIHSEGEAVTILFYNRKYVSVISGGYADYVVDGESYGSAEALADALQGKLFKNPGGDTPEPVAQNTVIYDIVESEGVYIAVDGDGNRMSCYNVAREVMPEKMVILRYRENGDTFYGVAGLAQDSYESIVAELTTTTDTVLLQPGKKVFWYGGSSTITITDFNRDSWTYVYDAGSGQANTGSFVGAGRYEVLRHLKSSMGDQVTIKIKYDGALYTMTSWEEVGSYLKVRAVASVPLFDNGVGLKVLVNKGILAVININGRLQEAIEEAGAENRSVYASQIPYENRFRLLGKDGWFNATYSELITAARSGNLIIDQYYDDSVAGMTWYNIPMIATWDGIYSPILRGVDRSGKERTMEIRIKGDTFVYRDVRMLEAYELDNEEAYEALSDDVKSDKRYLFLIKEED